MKGLSKISLGAFALDVPSGRHPPSRSLPDVSASGGPSLTIPTPSIWLYLRVFFVNLLVFCLPNQRGNSLKLGKCVSSLGYVPSALKCT